MWSCPVCGRSMPNSKRLCACGLDVTGDFLSCRTVCRVPPEDVARLRKLMETHRAGPAQTEHRDGEWDFRWMETEKGGFQAKIFRNHKQ